MIEDKEKTTVPIPSVGADGEQPISNYSTSIISADFNEINPQFPMLEDDFAEIQRRIARMNDPSYLNAITMAELFDTVYQDAEPIVEKLLFPGLYIFAGAPKKGKSYVMLQMAYQICTGSPLWGHPVRQGPCLYLALEDKFSRLQRRLYQMYGTNPTDQLYLAVLAKQIGEGLEQQIEGFVREHPGTQLVIIDTLQKVRSGKSSARNEYAADYESMGPLKQLADQLGICIMMVHHTRKQEADDPFDTVSGTNGIHGSVDGTFVFKRSRGQTPTTGTIDVTGRDVAEQRMYLNRNDATMLWIFDHTDTEFWDDPPDPTLEAIASLLSPEQPEWSGTATALVDALKIDMKPNALSMKLNVNASRLHTDYCIRYKCSRSHAGRNISLKLITKDA